MRAWEARALVGLALVSGTSGIGAWPSDAAAKEFRANKTTANSQSNPSVAPLGSGGFVVVWHASAQDGDTVNEYNIYAQRFKADGDKAKSEFSVNTSKTFSQETPSVGGLANGGFVVVWHTFGTEGAPIHVRGQRFKPNGDKDGDEFRVSKSATNDKHRARVVGLSDGGFVAVYTRRLTTGSLQDIFAQRFGVDGKKAGGEFRVNDTRKNDQDYAAVAALPGGAFVVAWQSMNKAGTDYDVNGQRFLANGDKDGGQFRINGIKADHQHAPRITALTGGGFVAVWAHLDLAGTAGGVFGQRFTAGGAKDGGEFPLATTEGFIKTAPDVAELANGGFIAVWHSIHQDADFSNGVYGQRFSNLGVKDGDEIHLNQTSADTQQLPAVARFGNGFVGVWESNLQDGSQSGVFGRKFAH